MTTELANAVTGAHRVGISEWVGATDAQIIVSEIDDAASAMDGCYEHLSASAKAGAIKLGHALSSLRRRMVAPNNPDKQ